MSSRLSAIAIDSDSESESETFDDDELSVLEADDREIITNNHESIVLHQRRTRRRVERFSSNDDVSSNNNNNNELEEEDNHDDRTSRFLKRPAPAAIVERQAKIWKKDPTVNDFTCPITLEIPVDPVSAIDGKAQGYC